jgi:hypothetical protein
VIRLDEGKGPFVDVLLFVFVVRLDEAFPRASDPRPVKLPISLNKGICTDALQRIEKKTLTRERPELFGLAWHSPAAC